MLATPKAAQEGPLQAAGSQHRQALCLPRKQAPGRAGCDTMRHSGRVTDSPRSDSSIFPTVICLSTPCPYTHAGPLGCQEIKRLPAALLLSQTEKLADGSYPASPGRVIEISQSPGPSNGDMEPLGQ